MKTTAEVSAGFGSHMRGDGTIHVTIVTPSGDAGSLRESVASMLRQKFNRSVDVTERKDPSLIGGAIITFGDEQIDMSVRGALRQAAVSFLSAGASDAPR